MADSLSARLIAWSSRRQLWSPGDRVAVAVSGGADSVALLCLLAPRAEALGLQLAVAHFDHAWRSDSVREAEFVAALAERFRLPFHGQRADTRPDRDREQHARRARYGFLLGLIARGAATRIATAHTADDQAETVLLRLLRGTGASGLAGILPARPDGIVRPLLWARRRELRAWLQAQGQPWCEDPGNQDLTLTRNRLRAELLPRLEAEYNPALVPSLCALAELAGAEEQFWAVRAARLADDLGQAVPGGLRLPCAPVRLLPPAEQRRLLREVVRRVQGDLRAVGFGHLDRLLAWIAQPASHPRRLAFARVACRLTTAYLEVVRADGL